MDTNSLPFIPNDPDDEDERALEEEYREYLPRTGDKLFHVTDNSAYVDPNCVDPAKRCVSGRWSLYSDGFCEAADRVVESYRGTPGEDSLIYPVLNLYRHHLELEMKALIKGCPSFLSRLDPKEIEEKVEKLKKEHSLQKLWDVLKKVYPGHCSCAPGESVCAFECLIKEIDDADPKGQSGRYPIDTQGNPTLARLRFVDLALFKAGVHKMAHFLDCIFEAMCEEQEWRSEMASW